MAAQLHPRDVKIAMGALRADLARAWKVGDLAKICGVARRTLEKHFQQFVGCAPVEFLRDERLKQARRKLLRARPGANVTVIAGECGFAHFGRFSLEYRRRYGESPSNTLRYCRTLSGVQQRPSQLVPLSFDRPTVSVSPFELIGSNATHMAGTAEDIAAALLRTGWISVVAAPKGRYLLSGSIRDAGSGGIRVRTALLDCSTGRILWANRWDCSPVDTQGFQDWVSAQIAGILRSTLQAAEVTRASRTDPTQRTAWELGMQALPLVLAADPTAPEIAAELLGRAIELAPRDPVPMSLLAWHHGLRAAHHFTVDPDRERKAALRLATDAATLSATDPFADVMLSAAYMLIHDLSAAEVHARRALAIDGGSAWAWGRLGWVHAYRGEAAAAIEHCQIARVLAPSDPLNFVWSIGIAAANFESDRYDEAVSWYQRALTEQPRASWINRFLAPTLALGGRKDDARQSFHDLRRVFPDLTIMQVKAGLPHTDSLLDRVAEGLESVGMRMS
jgi:AraC-like DNA-binding protein